MDKNKNSQQTIQLNKQLNTLLSGFEKNKAWTDIGTWLYKVEQAIKENPSPLISEKVSLAKRLAQCLNPLLPQTINLQSLKIYEIIFENIKIASSSNIEEYKKMFCEDIAIYSVGLFPYFQISSQNNKHYFLQIIRNYYIPVGRDLIPCLPGLVLSILPGLEEQNETIIKDVTKTLEEIMQSCGRRYFIGSVWMGIMRSQRGREHAIKFLMKYLPKNQLTEDEEQDEQSDNSSNLSDDDYDKYNKNDAPLEQNQDQKSQGSSENKHSSEGQDINAQQQVGSLNKYNMNTEGDQQEQQQNNEQEQQHQDSPQIPQSNKNSNPPQLRSDSKFKKNELVVLDQKVTAKSALELQFQQEVGSKQNKKQDFANSFYIRDNLKYIEENINGNDNENNFPNKSTLIINTILSCFEDDKQIVKRNILDLMHHHLRINHPILSRDDQLVLVEGVLYLLIKKDVSVARRVNVWLFGKPDMDNKYTVTKKREFVIDLITDAFQRILNVDPIDKQTAQQPLKIMQQFYLEHENFVELTLSKLSLSLIRYVYTHTQNIQFSQDILKSGIRFMENISGYINSLIRSLSDEAVQLSSQKKDEQCLEIIKFIEFTYDHLLDSTGESFDPQQARDCIKETLARLFISLSFFDEINIREFQSTEPILKVIYKLMLKLEKAEEQIKQIEKKEKKVIEINQEQRDIALYLDECSEKYYIFYGKLSNELEKIKSINIYKLASQSLVKIQKFLYDKKRMVHLPQWFKCISQSIKIPNPNISLIAIESMIEIMISEKLDPIYEQLKILIIEEAKLKYSKKNEIIVAQDYTKLTLEKLWSLLDFQHFHDRIIDLIIHFSKYFPQYFKEVVVNSFQAVSITEKEAAIRRFAVFWRLTANHKSKSLLADLNKVGLFIMLDFLDHDNPLIRHASKNWLMESVPQFYRVIDPLFEVLLQANSSWYVTDSYQVFYTKIYETTRANETFRKLKSILVIASDVFLKYLSGYELSLVLQDLKSHFTDKNQAILIRKIGATMSYFNTINPNSNIVDPSLIQSNSQKQQQKVTDYKMSYLDLLIIICLRYIQGQALESLSLKFQVENAAVNASACEFLELLITHLEDPPLCLALCEYLMEPLLTILGHCITNRDFVMQVQLLNVFRIIFFHSSYIKKNNIEEIRFKLVQTLSNRLFIPNILKGLISSIPYVRSQFISFISACIPLISTFLVSNQLTSIVKSIMFTYFSLIKHLSTTPAQENDDPMVTISKTQTIKQPSLIKTNKTVILIQTQEVVKEDSNIYEIHTVLEGVRSILQFYLKIRTLEEIESSKKQEGGGFMNVMKTVLTLGIAGGNSNANDKDKDGKVIFEKYPETCKSLLYDIKQVVELFINSWQTTPEFINEFTSYGIRPYEQKKYNLFNNLLLEMIKNAEKDKQRVKILIISIIKPLVYEFPNELMNSFLTLWNRGCATDSPRCHSDFHQNEFLKKMIEMLTILNIPTELFLESFFQSFISELIQNFYKQKNYKEKKGVYYLNYEIAQHESKILYFLYIYLCYAYIDSKTLQKENLLGFWSQVIKILKVFQPSKNPNTIMWQLDLLYMLSEKYSPKEILSDGKFKKDFHDLINEKLVFMSGWIAHIFQVKFNETTAQTQQSLNNAVDQHMKSMIVQSLQQYKVLSPYPPTIYELSLTFYSQLHILEHAPKTISIKMKEQQMNQLDQQIFDKIETSDETLVYDKYRLLILETLKILSLELLQNTYSPERQDRVVSRVKEFVDPLYVVIDNKTMQNTNIIESSSELICSLLEKAPALLIKDFKKNILETFNKDNFFFCNKTTLRYWGKIIDWVITHDKSSDLYTEYLEKVGLSAGFFAREQTENKRKIKAFKRICFIIFSGSKDKYANRLHTLLDRISEVIKQDSTHSSLLILILFCIRILILRLSQSNLNDLFKQIWPILLTLLIQIYSKPLPGQPPRHPNLMLAGLKLIEILSVAQIDEFYLHQWMFIFDYFGLKLQPLSLQERENQMKLRGQMNEDQLKQQAKISPFYFQPFVSTCLNEQDLTINYINQPQDDIDNPDPTTFQKKQRKIVMTQCKVDDESELKNYALALCYYLISNNENRTEIDYQQIEELIEDDFINLDEFILKV